MRPAPGMRIAIDLERPEDLFAWFDHVPSGTISSVLRWQQMRLFLRVVRPDGVQSLFDREGGSSDGIAALLAG